MGWHNNVALRLGGSGKQPAVEGGGAAVQGGVVGVSWPELPTSNLATNVALKPRRGSGALEGGGPGVGFVPELPTTSPSNLGSSGTSPVDPRVQDPGWSAGRARLMTHQLAAITPRTMGNPSKDTGDAQADQVVGQVQRQADPGPDQERHRPDPGRLAVGAHQVRVVAPGRLLPDRETDDHSEQRPACQDRCRPDQRGRDVGQQAREEVSAAFPVRAATTAAKATAARPPTTYRLLPADQRAPARTAAATSAATSATVRFDPVTR